MRPPNPFAGRHQRTNSHLQECSDCAGAVRRERQYLERLRDAPVPQASEDLTARLLARTHEFAARQPAAQPEPPRRFARAVALTAGGTVAAAGVLAVGALAVSGSPLPDSTSPAALSHVSARTPADGRALTAGQLALLRDEGWACPELAGLGFRLESARALVIDGQPAVEIRLSDGIHYATVTEQHSSAAALRTAADGVEVRSASPWSVTYRTEGRTFTYDSDLPAEQADDAVPILERVSAQAGAGVAAEAPASGTVAGESLAHRLQRGLNRIVTLLTQ